MQTIYFPASSVDSLFDGAATVDLAGIDQDASCAQFDAVLIAQLERYYPDTKIVAGHGHGIGNGYYASGFGDMIADSAVSEQVQVAAEDLFGDGNRWMVDAS